MENLLSEILKRVDDREGLQVPRKRMIGTVARNRE
jgi:hypothetical protein